MSDVKDMYPKIEDVDQNIMDDIDIKILNLLSFNGRMSYAEISRHVNISRMAVRDRVINLEEKGIIQKFSVLVDARKIGYNVSVFLLIKVKPKLLERVAQIVSKLPNIVVVYSSTGLNALHVHGFVEDTVALEQFIQNEIYSIEGVIEVESNLLLKRYKSERMILI
ncbi:MAG: Lrp/AsnC family transcriptional regulator [Clostridiales bacterium]|nr:Lrp/AsnC family transcriptional regulator [Clostridiales bacterium]MCF8022048.1 Lrp/AsnC family transcriptional regulator [Clostridiales bacterium]